MNYLIGNFLISIKNASLARRRDIVLPFSNVTKEIGKVLVKEGFLSEVKEDTDNGKRILRAGIRYENRKPVVTDIKLVSKPSLRAYKTTKEIAHTLTREAMTLVLSTSMGVMTGKEALKKKIGGEVLFKIW